MGTAKPLIEDRALERAGVSYMYDTAERQIIKELDERFQNLVERTAALVGAPRASLTMLDPVSQTLVTTAAFSKIPTGPYQASLRVHEGIARWVATYRTPAVIENLALDRRAQALGALAVGSLLCVPLLSGQQVLGAITVSNPAISAFKPPHLKLLELLADLAAVAVLQARQLEASAQQSRHLNTMLELARSLGSAPDAHKVFGLAVAGIRRLVRCEEAVIFYFDSDTKTLVGVAGLGVQSSQLAERRILLHDPQSVTAWVAQQRRPLMHSSDARAFVGPVTEVLMTQQDTSLLSVPLVAGERLWGVITLTRSLAFTAAELRTMLTLGNMIAPALAQVERIERG